MRDAGHEHSILLLFLTSSQRNTFFPRNPERKSPGATGKRAGQTCSKTGDGGFCAVFPKN
jgi:hypothetical protein